MDTSESVEIHSLLEKHGLSSAELSEAEGFANRVVLTADHVVRLNTGRFPDAFRHEANVLHHLPSEIPHPGVVAFGTREAGGEYLILQRLPGENLERVWGAMSSSDRARVMRELAGITQCLHQLPAAEWMRNPWVEDVLATRRWKDAYHAPPSVFTYLVESAALERPDTAKLLEALSPFLTARLPVFDDEPDVFTHTDLHFRNVIVDSGHITGIVDFEGSRLGVRDAELDMLIRSVAPFGREPAARYSGAISTFRAVYPELFAHRHLISRLEVYEALWHLVQLHHWQPGDEWMGDPAEALHQLIDGDFAIRVREVLDEGVLPDNC